MENRVITGHQHLTPQRGQEVVHSEIPVRRVANGRKVLGQFACPGCTKVRSLPSFFS